MKKTLLTLSVFCFLTLVAHSQNKYLEGYVVTLSKDTIRGYLYDNDTDWKSKAIEFKTALTAESKSFPIDELSSFYLKDLNNYFFIRTLEVDKKPIRIDQLKSNANPKVVTETIIIKLLASGKINLFGYVDENSKRHFFVQKDNEEIKELGYLKFITSYNKIVERPFYIGTLKFLTNDCLKIKFNTISYEERPLKALIDKYNSCFIETPRYVRKGDGVKLSGGILAGGKYSTFHVGAANNDFGLIITQNPGFKFKSSTSAMAGFFLDLQSKRAHSPFAASVQGMYHRGTFSNLSQSTDSSSYTFKANLSYLTIGVGVKYYFLKNEINKFYILSGLGVNHMLNYTVNVNFIDPYNSFVNFYYPSPHQFGAVHKDGLNYYLGIGYSFHHAVLELRGQHDGFDGGERLLSVSLALGYRIF